VEELALQLSTLSVRLPDSTSAKISDLVAASIPDLVAVRLPDVICAQLPDLVTAKLPDLVFAHVSPVASKLNSAAQRTLEEVRKGGKAAREEVGGVLLDCFLVRPELTRLHTANTSRRTKGCVHHFQWCAPIVLR